MRRLLGRRGSAYDTVPVSHSLASVLRAWTGPLDMAEIEVAGDWYVVMRKETAMALQRGDVTIVLKKASDV